MRQIKFQKEISTKHNSDRDLSTGDLEVSSCEHCLFVWGQSLEWRPEVGVTKAEEGELSGVSINKSKSAVIGWKEREQESDNNATAGQTRDQII